MAISTAELLVEIGSEAYDGLTSQEVLAICQSVNDAVNGGMKAFEILWKKFNPTYKMGKMYVRDSDRYEAYRRIHAWYCQKVNAGYTSTATQDSPLDQWE